MDRRPIKLADLKLRGRGMKATLSGSKVILAFDMELVAQRIVTTKVDQIYSQFEMNPGPVQTLVLMGEIDDDRVNIRINGRLLSLTANSFVLLAKLAMPISYGYDGYVHKSHLGQPALIARYIHRLKSECWSYGLELHIDNDQKGGYRLLLQTGSIQYNHKHLESYPDATIRDLLHDGSTLWAPPGSLHRHTPPEQEG